MRILFKKGEQKKFLKKVCVKLEMNLKKISLDFEIPYEALKKYYSERRTLPINVANILSDKSKIDWKRFQVIKYLDDSWGQSKGGKKGYKAMIKKYPYKLNEWRWKGIKKSTIGIRSTKEVKIPKMCDELSEFIGICLGDGTLTKYFVKISLDSRYDACYSEYIKKLCNKLFGIKISEWNDKKEKMFYLALFSVKVCEFLYKECGLPYGDKIINEASIPTSILNNDRLMICCLRGLIDTDGCISKGKSLGFFSNNKKLLDQVKKMGKKLNIFTSSNEISVSTGKWDNIVRYFRIVGSSNLKNIIKFNEKLKGKELYSDEVTKFYNKYKNVDLPFKLRVDGPVG